MSPFDRQPYRPSWRNRPRTDPVVWRLVAVGVWRALSIVVLLALAGLIAYRTRP